MERRCGSVVEFGRATFAKRRCPPKNQQSDFISKPVLGIDMTLLLRVSVQLLAFPFHDVMLLERSVYFFGGLSAKKWLLVWGICESSIILGALGKAPQSELLRRSQIMCNSS